MFGLGCLKMCRLLWLASAEYGAVVSAVGRASAHRPACRCFTVVAACRCFGGLKPTLPKGKQLFAVIFVLFPAQGYFVRQAFADGVGQGIEFVEDGDDFFLFGEWWDGD